VMASARTAPAQDAPAGRPTRRVLKGGCVLSMDPAVGNFESADVLIEGSRIAAIRPRIEASDAEIFDATNRIVIPGFVDTHRHMWQGFLRNIQPNASLVDYRDLIQRAFGSVMTPDDVHTANMLSALGCIDAGITTVLDWSHIQNSPEHTDAAIAGLRESGVRAVFAYGNGQTLNGNWWELPRQKFPDDIVRLRRDYFSSDDQLMTLFLAAPSAGAIQRSPLDAVVQAFTAARNVGAGITMHVGVGPFGRIGLLEKLNDMNALGPDITFIHCCTLNDAEWRLIRDTGATVSMAGYVEMMMGHGNPPIQKALDLGIRPSLSTDVETSVPNDFFTQMRTVFSLQRNQIWERELAGDKKPAALLTAKDVLEFATVEGARANKLDKKVGSLTPGKQADIVLLRTDMINVMPVNNALGAVFTSMGPQNVDTVIIAGEIKKTNGALVGVDLASLGKKVNEARERAFANAKVPLSRI
jgi:5-methylthioadenosine/S-adenosylhomocysteine deaminase